MRVPSPTIFALTLAAALGLGACSASSLGSGSDNPPRLGIEWEYDLEPDYGFAAWLTRSIDNINGQSFYLTDEAIITTAELGSMDRAELLVAVDKISGELLWDQEIPRVLCADPSSDATILCTHDDAAPTAVRIDLATGETVEQWELDVTSIWGVAPLGDGVVVLDEAAKNSHTLLTFLDGQGQRVWELDLAELGEGVNIVDRTYNSVEHQEIFGFHTAYVGENLVLHNGDIAVLALADGSTPRTMTCRQIYFDDAGFVCDSSGRLVRFDTSGKVAWALDDVRLLHAVGREVSPIGWLKPWDRDESQFVVFDLVTGEPGPNVAVEKEQGWRGFQVGDYSLLTDNDTALLVEVATGAVKWEVSDNDLVSAWELLEVGDLYLDPGFPTNAYYQATGELAWSHLTELSINTDGQRLYGSAYRSLILYDLP